MTQRLLVAFLTVLVFASGFAARVWTESKRPLPPPPAAIGSEFAPTAQAPSQTPTPIDAKKLDDRRAQMIADIEKLGPQIATYRARLDEMDACFERDFVKILTPAQREARQRRWETTQAEQKKRAEKSRSETTAKSPAQLSNEEIERGLRTPLSTLLSKVTVSEKLKRLIEQHNLDADQQVQARRLLTEYRGKFLDLVDSLPPTSFRLSGLAQDVQKFAPASAPAAAPKP